MQFEVRHIRSKAILSGVFLLIAFGGCVGPLKKEGRNFTAYYNTFYNAKINFSAGLQKNDAQVREINPLEFIRIHFEPVNAGAADFDKAITKSSDILRKFDETKWVDDAIELIGKSYYYRREYFSADQKFQELYVATDDDLLKQQAVYWKGRVMLELKNHEEAISFLNNELLIFEGKWNRELLAETKAVLAQHYVAVGEYERAEAALEGNIEFLSEKKHKARAYFLYGQLLEMNAKPGQAITSLGNVQKYYQDYTLLYNANLKSAQIARDIEAHDDAFKIFDTMSRDDKNYKELPEIKYELARTDQQRGNYDKAESLYNSILRDQVARPTKETVAKIYFGLAEIYRFGRNNFSMAAAYYDSSARQNIPPERLPENFNAAELKLSFGEYNRLKNEISYKDSLLWLASLPKDVFDAEIAKQKQQRLEQLREQLRLEEQRRNTLTTVNPNQGGSQGATPDQNSGFLGYKNPIYLADARAQFKAIWGNRPLVDHWRRAAAIRNIAEDSTNLVSEASENTTLTPGTSISINDIQIDISQIPFDEADKEQMLASLSQDYFQLGNLFFLSLDMPDSAAYYFNKIRTEFPGSAVYAVATYSLSELNSNEGNNESARLLAEELNDTYSQTPYAALMREKYDLPEPDVEIYEKSDVYERYLELMNQQENLTYSEAARKFKQLFEEDSESKIAPDALYRSALMFSEAAKDSSYLQNIELWVQERDIYSKYLKNLTSLKDSARVALRDTAITPDKRQYWVSITDSAAKPSNFIQYFPYFGAFWDSTRTTLDHFKKIYPQHALYDFANRLRAELEVPQELKVQAATAGPAKNEGVSSANIIYNCRELQIEPEISGGETEFLKKVQYPEWTKGIATPIKAEYTLLIATDGSVESFQLLTRAIARDLSTALNTAIREELMFKPILVDGKAVKVECRKEFELRPGQ